MRFKVTTARCGRRRLPGRVLRGTLIALSIVVSAVGGRAAANDPIGVEPSTQQLRAALATMDATFNALPASAREVLAVDVKLLGQAVDGTLFQIEQAPVPPVDEAVVHDLDFLTDLLVATTGELAAIERLGESQPDADILRRIEGLSNVATARLGELDRTTAAWIDRTRRDLIEVQNDAGTVVLHAVDRSIQATIRQAGVVLLLVGLLLVGLQLLRGGTERERVLDRSSAAAWRWPAAVGALALFFVAALVLTIHPSSLSRLAATEEIHPQEHPCQRLASQRERLELAQGLGYGGLIEASKHRMTPAAMDCLGLPSEEVALAAVERLAARSVTTEAAATPAEDRPATPLAATTQASARAATAGVGGPAGAEELPSPGVEAASSSEALAELLAALRAQVTPDDAAAIETEAVTPSPDEAATPEPAAGPATDSPPAEVAPPERATYTVTTGLNYRSGPSTEATRLGSFAPGARVRVVGFDDDWAEIELNDGRRVFAFSDFLEPAP